MTSRVSAITIRNIDEALKQRLRMRAAQHGRSMEEEARDILRCALSTEPATGADLAASIRALFAPFGGVELPEIEREPVRDPPDFSS